MYQKGWWSDRATGSKQRHAAEVIPEEPNNLQPYRTQEIQRSTMIYVRSTMSWDLN